MSEPVLPEPVLPEPVLPESAAAESVASESVPTAVMTPQDEEHLRLLAIGHLVLSGLIALFALFPVLHLVMGIGMGVGGVFFWVNKKAKKRIAMIEEQLPDAVELMVRSLRVGHPFSSAISIVSKEIKDPLATEFGLIADESSYGRDIGEALKAIVRLS